MARPLTLDRLLTVDQQREIVAMRARGATRREIARWLATCGIEPTPAQLRMWLEHADRRLERARDMATLEAVYGPGRVRETIAAAAGMLAHAIIRRLEAVAELPTAELFVLARALEHAARAREELRMPEAPALPTRPVIPSGLLDAIFEQVYGFRPNHPETSADLAPPLRNGHDA